MRENTPRGQVGLGDLIQAHYRLALSDAQLRIAGEALSVAPGHASQGQRKPHGAAERRLRRRSPGRLTPPPRQLVGRLAQPAVIPLSAPRFETTLQERDAPAGAADNAAEKPAWLDKPGPHAPEQPALTREPLFAKRTSSALLATAIATPARGHNVDVLHVIGALARLEPLASLPRLMEFSVSRGVQLLLDQNETMTPFFPDFADLEHNLKRIVGSARCAVFEFSHHPLAAIQWSPTGEQNTWQPNPDQPILVATDFARGDRASADPASRARHWRALRDTALSANARLICLTPLPPSRWPRWLDESYGVIHWDRRTRTGTVMHSIARGRRTTR